MSRSRSERAAATGMGERIQKVLSRAGLASRREAERWLEEGRITVNGCVIKEPGTRVDLAKDSLKVDGRRVRGLPRRVFYLLNKPPGFVTTTRDPQGRPVVTDLLRGVHQRVFPVGRLDVQTTGLLLLTNDGALARKMLLPTSGLEKVYRVKVRGVPSDAALRRLRAGIKMDGRMTRPCRIRRRASGTNTWLDVSLTEGKNNQIRRMFARIGHPVSKLRRVAIGPLTDRGLAIGRYRRLTEEEIRRVEEALA